MRFDQASLIVTGPTRNPLGLAARPSLWLVALGSALFVPTAAATIYVLPGPDVAQFQAAHEGIRQQLGKVAAVWLGPGDSVPPGGNFSPSDVVLAVGARAAGTAVAAGAPGVVGCMLVNPAALADANRPTLVGLSVAPAVAAEHLRRILPAARRIAVIHGPSSAAEAQQLSAALKAAGLRPELVAVSPAADLNSDALLGLRQADAMLVTADPLLTPTQAAHSLLLAAMRTRTPVVGLSQAWVRAGALYALERDYTEVGRQCGASALALAGYEVGPAPGAARVTYTLNRRSAVRLGISLPEVVLAGAAQVLE